MILLLVIKTDARSVEEIESTIDRTYIDAGADMIFPEGLNSFQSLRKFQMCLRNILLPNMTKLGKRQ